MEESEKKAYALKNASSNVLSKYSNWIALIVVIIMTPCAITTANTLLAL
jgi:hypothetical protein